MRKYLILLVCLILCVPLMATEKDIGTTAGNLLKIEAGVKGASMGGAFCAVADNVFGSLYWNAGGLGLIDKREAEFSYNSWLQGINQGYLSYGQSTKIGTLALGISYFDFGSMKETVSNPAGRYDIKGDFGATSMLVQIGYGRSIASKRLNLGISVKYISDKIKDDNKTAYAIDAGILYKTPFTNLSAGLAIQNLGTKLADYPLPQTIRLGLSYKLSALLFALDLNMPNDNKSDFRLGGEYTFKAISFRLGYNSGLDDDKLGSTQGLPIGITGGLGFRFSRFEVNYAFVPYGDLGNTQRISLNIGF